MTSAAIDALVGSSAPMVELRQYIRKVARSEANVLITGDTGTGKERVAQSIHYASPRRDGPFVSVNCAAVPDSLLESELFGYEKGAFTGANDNYAGKLRMASGGTVFLDEIGDMSPVAQTKILRVLENREVSPLGARRLVNIDVRFIAATNQELESLIAQQRFRRDLYYRLNVARMTLPCLKDRIEDVPELLAHYIAHFNQRYGEPVTGISAEVTEYLTNYDWPGNIRELKNLVEAIFIDPPQGVISLSHLPETFRRVFSQFRKPVASEREQLVSVLSASNWNKSKAAERMNWSRMTLYRKMSKYRINTPFDSAERSTRA